MRVPSWAIIVGICMLLFGGCGELQNIQSIYVPGMLEMQQELFEKASEAPIPYEYEGEADSLAAERFKNITEGMQSLMTMSESTQKWIVRFGYIGIFVSGVYMLGGLFLILRMPFSIKLAYAGLILSIVFSVARAIVLSSDSSSLLAMSSGFSHIFGIVIDIILLAVVFKADKAEYFAEERSSDD